jgi:hypothetical protein
MVSKYPQKKPMPKLVWDEEYWRSRATEARTMGDQIRHPDCKRIMGEMARSYDHLAELTKQSRESARIPADLALAQRQPQTPKVSN